MIFGSGRAMHKRLLAFAAESPHEIEYNGKTYVVHHSQFGSYPIRDLFVTLVEQTNANPLDAEFADEMGMDSNFTDEAVDALEQSQAYVNEDAQNFYRQRERVTSHNLESAVRDYCRVIAILENGEQPHLNIQPTAEMKEEAIAEILTLLHADRASLDSDFSYISRSSDDDRDVPDTYVDQDIAMCALQEVIATEEGFSVLSRPDPSLSTVRALYDMYDEIGMDPAIRDVYGLFTDMNSPISKSVRDSTRSIGSRGDVSRWVSENEPPLTTLDSYSLPD